MFFLFSDTKIFSSSRTKKKKLSFGLDWVNTEKVSVIMNSVWCRSSRWAESSCCWKNYQTLRQFLCNRLFCSLYTLTINFSKAMMKWITVIKIFHHICCTMWWNFFRRSILLFLHSSFHETFIIQQYLWKIKECRNTS